MLTRLTLVGNLTGYVSGDNPSLRKKTSLSATQNPS